MLNQRTRFARPLAALAVAVVLAITAVAAAPAQANHGNYWLVVGPDLGNLDCTPGNPAWGLFDISFTGVTSWSLSYTITNLTDNTPSPYVTGGGNITDNDYDDFPNYQWFIPAGTGPGDVLEHHLIFTANGSVVSDSTMAWVCDTGKPVGGITDDRINPEGDGLTTAAVFCTDDHGVDILGIDPDSGEGLLAIHLSADELAALPDAPSEPMLVAEAGGIKLYKLPSGELAMHAATVDGKTYVYIWNGCPHNGDPQFYSE